MRARVCRGNREGGRAAVFPRAATAAAAVAAFVPSFFRSLLLFLRAGNVSRTFLLRPTKEARRTERERERNCMVQLRQRATAALTDCNRRRDASTDSPGLPLVNGFSGRGHRRKKRSLSTHCAPFRRHDMTPCDPRPRSPRRDPSLLCRPGGS